MKKYDPLISAIANIEIEELFIEENVENAMCLKLDTLKINKNSKKDKHK